MEVRVVRRRPGKILQPSTSQIMLVLATQKHERLFIEAFIRFPFKADTRVKRVDRVVIAFPFE